jgi:hypothetical protein
MLIDTEHLHHWMQAIRQSPDPMRTMDAFWQGQLKSKEWLIESLTNFCSIKDKFHPIITSAICRQQSCSCIFELKQTKRKVSNSKIIPIYHEK